MRTPVYFAFLFSVLLFGAIAQTNAQTAAAMQQPAATVPATVNRAKMLQLVNEVRRKGCQCGDTYYYPAPPVTWNAQLEAAAYYHTADMVKNKFFSHYAPDGSRGSDRIERAGYHWKTFGENIGQGYKTEKEMLEGWLASPGHCKNIMNKSYTEMGAARVGTVWTQEFGSR